MEEAVHLRKGIGAVKKHASDVQLFMGSKKLNKPVDKLVEYAKSIYESAGMDKTDIVFTVNEQINSISENIRSFGIISINHTPLMMTPFWQEETSAQTLTLKNGTVAGIGLNRKQSFQFGDITACTILNDGNIVVGKRVLVEHSEIAKYTRNGKLVWNLLIAGSHCYGIVPVNENIVAVTSGGYNKYIYMIDVSNHLQIVKIIKSDFKNYGATFHDESLITCKSNKGIRRVNITTEKSTMIVPGNVKRTYIVADDSYLYHSNHHTNSVVCYDFNGKTQWTYRGELLKSPRGIAIDGKSNLYVAGYDSNNVVVISSDGKQGKELLSSSDGICIPICIHVNSGSNILLVANENGPTFLYELTN